MLNEVESVVIKRLMFLTGIGTLTASESEVQVTKSL
jgi:hypothetical protein